MSAHVLANEGLSLVKASKYSEGIEKLTQALKSQRAPMWLIERSKAYLRTNDFELALHDAEQALSIALSRANRDLMIEAQIRRAVTLYRMNRYADTDVCAFWAIRLLDGAKASEDDGQQNKADEDGNYTITLKEVQEASQAEAQAKKDAGLGSAMSNGGRSKDTTNRNLAFSWRINALTAMEKLEHGAFGRKVTVPKYPTPSDTPPVKAKEVQTERIVEIESDDEVEEDANKPKIPQHIIDGTQPLGGPVKAWSWSNIWELYEKEAKKRQVRTDWYESDTTANVSLFVKNVPKESVKVDSQEQSVTVSPIPNVPDGFYTVKLQGKIKPEETTFTVKSMKIELVLKKEVPGKWKTLTASGSPFPSSQDDFLQHVSNLEYKDPQTFNTANFGGDIDAWYSDLYKKLFSKSAAGSSAVAATAPSKQLDTAPISQAPLAKSSGPAYPTSSKSGPKNWDNLDVDDDDEKDDNVDDFFKKLYKDADPDTRRAMMKSYTESNGTSLSTSWNEASIKTYKTEAPNGAEAKSWDA